MFFTDQMRCYVKILGKMFRASAASCLRCVLLQSGAIMHKIREDNAATKIIHRQPFAASRRRHKIACPNIHAEQRAERDTAHYERNGPFVMELGKALISQISPTAYTYLMWCAQNNGGTQYWRVVESARSV
ncbi:hypothetical protein AJ79_07126 [Helicocarpus griseus UAMH5409]|uniref:Uncharacterized protein n=1 Tax=Helicocarpus griseus UAMH5409 TaxID=1447875 RepID=A0A2B7X5X4_9EURO|nr:hypothetical protein AJ79_07126 [Helicocarpus griseus UAMH5409]